MATALEKALELGEELSKIPIENCGPSDDPDKQYAYTAAFRDVALRFISAVKRIRDPDLVAMVEGLAVDTLNGNISEAHHLKAELVCVIDALNEAIRSPDFGSSKVMNSDFIDANVLLSLEQINASQFDTSKLVVMCKELNKAYIWGHYISAILLIRAVMNHVPSVFGFTTFEQVASNSGKSVKNILSQLENARPIADMHTHLLMKKSERMPTKNQVEPYKSAFEVLLHEVITKLDEK